MMLTEKIQKLVDAGISGTDILHGQLKNMMYEAEQDMLDIDVDDPVYKYMEGLLDSYIKVQELVIDLTYALDERNKK